MNTFKLTKSIKDGDTEITELTFRELSVGDLITADAVEGDLARIVAALALSANVPLPVFKTISANDLPGIIEANAELVGN